MTTRPTRTAALVVFAAALAFALTVLSALPAQALAAVTPTASRNAYLNEYSRNWARQTTSHLEAKSDGTFERVEWTGGKLVVERFDSSFACTSSTTIDASTYRPSDMASSSTPLWGGYLAGSQYNFVVTGQTNPDEDENRVVVRVTRYTKAWKQAGQLEVRGRNTTVPFTGGTVDMLEQGGTLYVRTCHEMYASSDGYNHQANVTFLVDIASMAYKDGEWNVSNIRQSRFGYVSHSFNQRLAALGGEVYGLDHGDAYPRSVVVKKFGGTYYEVFPVLGGTVGDNRTGLRMGGFESSSTRGTLLAAISSVDQSAYQTSGAPSEPYNVYLSVLTPSSGGFRSVQLTSYTASSGRTAGNPQLVKVGEDRFLALWTMSENSSPVETRYVVVDGNGNRVVAEKSLAGRLSDCQPVVASGKVVWYSTGTSANALPSFHAIDTSQWGGGTVPLPSRDLKDAAVSWYSPTYTGSAQTLLKEVAYEGVKLEEGRDFVVQMGDRVNAGTHTATIQGVGAYTGTLTSSYTIKPAALSRATVASGTRYVYAGTVWTPKPTVTSSATPSATLREGVDYRLSYTNNVNAGTARVTATGLGNYQDSVSGSFYIDPLSITGAAVTVPDQTYTGSYLYPEPTVRIGAKTLVGGTDYSVSYSGNYSVGTATATVYGKGNYTGSAQGSFRIRGDLAQATVSASSQTYTGSALTPEVRVTFRGRTLTAGTDYGVAYANNVNAGTATVTVTGKGNYAGTIRGSFSIAAASLAGAKVTVANQTHTGSALTPEVTVVLGGRTLVAGSDYAVGFVNNVNVGTATATVAGKGNYTGTAKGTFAIVAAQNPPVPDKPTPAGWMFADVTPGDEANHASDVQWLGERGISTGWLEADGTRAYRGLQNVTRCDMARFLMRMAGVKDGTFVAKAETRAMFADVTDATPHAEAIWWLAEQEITKGWVVSGRREFRPYANVARQDMAAFLQRFARSQGMGVGRMGPEALTFRDSDPADEANHGAEVAWLASWGVTKGWSVGGGLYEFRGLAPVARQDMAAFLHRLDGVIG